MFLGHYGVAFALKRAEPRVSLGTLFFSVGLVDTMWGVFLLTGWEQARIVPGLTPVNPIEFIRYPLTHSLLAALAWAILAGGIMYTWPTRDTSHHHRMKALVVAIAVASHWVLDLVVHLPDLPLAGDNSAKLGLGLWKSFPATLAVEALVFLAGLATYAIWRRARGATGLGKTWFVAGLLILFYLASLFGSAPPNMTVVGIVDIVGTLLLAALATWADRAVVPGRRSEEKPPRGGRKAHA